MTRRTERMGAQLLEEVSRLLREEVTDPRIRLVTLTRADVSPDLSNAVLYYSALVVDTDADAGIESVDDGLASASGFLRRRAARALPWKRMPELRFRYDPSLALGSRTLTLLREIAEEDAAGGADAREPETEPEPGEGHDA